jgi:aminopeptidase N
MMARVSDDAAMVATWLDETDLPHGLRIDDALRWALVARLVTLGGDPRLIDTMLARDDTTSGHDHAAGARASVPTLAAKRAALDVVLHPSDRRVYEVYAIGAELWRPEQVELCAPLVEDYFAGLAATASFRQGWALARVVEVSFPRTMASPRTLELARGVLADSGLDGRVRREVADGADLLARILRVQGLEEPSREASAGAMA